MECKQRETCKYYESNKCVELFYNNYCRHSAKRINICTHARNCYAYNPEHCSDENFKDVCTLVDRLRQEGGIWNKKQQTIR